LPLLLRNEAAVPDADVLALMLFAQSRCRHPEKLVLAHVVKGTGCAPAQGYSWQRDPEDGARSRIRVSVTPSLLPARVLWRRRVGVVSLWDWRDEVVFTAAHELRHVDQYIDGVPRHYEVDAERFALGVLSEYRSEREREWMTPQYLCQWPRETA
jgi:hypothetical protein